MSNVALTCPSLSLLTASLCLPLLASFDIDVDVELMRWVRRAIFLHAKCNLQMCATHTHTHLHICWTALICIDSRTLETLISWASARSQCDGCSNLCLHSHNILFIKINDFDLTYNPSHAHAHHMYACLAKVEASPNENWILVNKYAQMHPLSPSLIMWQASGIRLSNSGKMLTIHFTFILKMDSMINQQKPQKFVSTWRTLYWNIVWLCLWF